MTTIITIVVVALVFFVTICVVAFMVWKRETEMRTDSIKAIEYNVEEMLYELTGNSSREIRRGRIRRGEDADREQGGAQQETNEIINEKRDDTGRQSESHTKTAQDPFGWMRKESAEEAGRREETADAEVKARENITVFEPAAITHEPYERRRNGAGGSKAGRYGLRWTEVTEEKRRGAQEREPEPAAPSDADIVSEPFGTPEEEPAPLSAYVTDMEPEIAQTPEVFMNSGPEQMPEMEPAPGTERQEQPDYRMPVELPNTAEEPQRADQLQPQPADVQYTQQAPQPLRQEQPPREGGMISKLLKRRRKQKNADEQEQQSVQLAEGQKQDRLFGWVENYEARNAHQTHDTPAVYEPPQEEQIYEPYEPYGKIQHAAHGDGGHMGAGYRDMNGIGHGDAVQMIHEDEWREKTVEDLLREYIDEPFGSKEAEISAPAETGYNIGKSGRRYTVEELETLIKE